MICTKEIQTERELIEEEKNAEGRRKKQKKKKRGSFEETLATFTSQSKKCV